MIVFKEAKKKKMKNAKSPWEKDQKGAGTLTIPKPGQACQPTRNSPLRYMP